MLVKYPIMGLSYAHGFFAICGGGGSLKSGIKNTVVSCCVPPVSSTGATHGGIDASMFACFDAFVSAVHAR